MNLEFNMARRSLEECITNYKKWCEEVAEALETLEKESEYLANLPAAPKTQQYGIEATMPRAGGISDPTANIALKNITRRKEVDRITLRKQQSIQFVDERRQLLETIRADEILQLMINGHNQKTIAETIGVTERTIRTEKDRIFETMLKG